MKIEISNDNVNIVIRKWSPYTVDLFTTYTTDNDVDIVVATDDIVTSAADKKMHGDYVLWTDEDDAYLLENHGKISNRELCEHLKRTQQAMYGRLRKIKKKPQTPETVFRDGEEVESEEEETVPMDVPPEGSDLFFEWLEGKEKEHRFKLEDVVNQVPDIDDEMLEKIIIFAIKQGIVLQMSKDVFLKSQKTI